MLLLRPPYPWDFVAAAEETDVSCESFLFLLMEAAG